MNTHFKIPLPKRSLMTFLKSLALTFALTTTPTFAKVIQLIHTNDLHSYFQGTRGGIGGYAQLKTVLDSLRQEATAQGIPTLHLDGGDFGEGSSFYFSNEGVDSLRALDLLGVDVTVLGNHDYILGGRELRNQIKAADLKATILSANLIGKRIMGLNEIMPDYVDYDFDGIKLRIFGLTTNEIHFMYPLRPHGFLTNSHNAGIRQARKAKKDKIDYTIALTHIGFENDINLVRKSSSIDLVVGGHTHIRLGKPEFTKNQTGRLIPILQAGAHSGYVGSMILDLKGNGESELIDYRMISIKKDMPEDPEVKSFVDEAYNTRERYFGRSWDEIIGYSEIPLSGNVNGHDPQSGTCWSRHMARLTREVAKTELGLHFDVFQGEQISAGPITYGDIVDNFPHFRKWGDQGWSVAKATISGFVLNKVLEGLAESELAIQIMIDGIHTEDKGKIVSFNPRLHSPQAALINGQNIENLRFYSISLPSEVPYGIWKFVSFLGRFVLINMTYLKDANYWPLMENYIQKNSPLRCLEN